MPRLSPSLLGQVVENRLIEYAMVLSRAALVVYRPEVDLEGTDLHGNRRHGNAILKVQVKGRYDDNGALILNFPRAHRATRSTSSSRSTTRRPQSLAPTFGSSRARTSRGWRAST